VAPEHSGPSNPSDPPSASAAADSVLEQLAELLELEGVARETALAALRASTPERARQLERLLDADVGEGPLDHLAPAVARAVDQLLEVEPEPPAPEQLGAWRLVEPLGRGGMGDVWLGVREQGGFAQRAAIKIVRSGLASGQIVSRFVLERQVLARLVHPAIAQLLDGGISPDGRPWFAMELVEGAPITEVASPLDLQGRLALMIRLCEAVDFAHRHLVVHRDLKPSNVLVTSEGELKLLDFGLAKILAPEEDPGLTRTEVRVLTPSYAAPEQVLGEPVTTATDVFSLGVMLYEVLTGELPFERSATSTARLTAQVASEEIEIPSSRLRRIERDRGEGAQARWARRVAGDLDTIVMAALRREPERRYRSAAAMADDLRSFLAGRPVAARPDSLTYRAVTFVRRHRVGIAAAAAVLLSLVGGLGAALVQADRARTAAARAQSEASRARAETERTMRIKEFLLSMFREASPLQRAGGDALSLEELLDVAEGRIEAELADEPLLQAELWDDLAETRAAAGDLAAADRLIAKALAIKLDILAADDPSLAESLANRGTFALFRGRFAEGLVDLDAARRILVAAGQSSSRLGAEIATTRTTALLQAGRLQEALEEAELAWELHREHTGPDHHETWMQLSNVAMIEMRLDRTAAAAQTFARVIEGIERSADGEHALLVYPLRGLGRAQEALGDAAAAEAAHRRAASIALERLGSGHASTALSELDIARLEIARGELAVGRPRLEEAIAVLQTAAPGRPELAQAKSLLALLPAGS
jgi:eukaryotic-like serine/threonine-protein kinase